MQVSSLRASVDTEEKETSEGQWGSSGINGTSIIICMSGQGLKSHMHIVGGAKKSQD